MEFSKINFKPTNQVARYMREIRQFWKQKIADGVPLHEIKNLEDRLGIETALPHEKFTQKDAENASKFLGWLTENNAIEFAGDYSATPLDVSKSESGEYVVSARLIVRVRDIAPLDYIEQQFPQENKKLDTPQTTVLAIRFEGREIYRGAKRLHLFQKEPKNKDFNFGKIFHVLWQYHIHHALSGSFEVGGARRLSIAEFEKLLGGVRSDSNFITDIQSNLAKLHKKGAGTTLDIVEKEDKSKWIQLVVDERS